VAAIRSASVGSEWGSFGMVKEPDPAGAESLAYEIGALFLNFGLFEDMLNGALGAALGLTDEQQRSLLRGMMARPKIELLESYAKAHFSKETTDKLAPVAADARRLADFRDQIAHGTIVTDADGTFHLATLRGEERFAGKAEPIVPQKVGEHVMLALQLGQSLETLARAVRAGATAAKPPPPGGA
jgi:hypothetical protein